MNIWVPRAKIIEPKRALALPTGMGGFFKLEAVKRDGRRRLLADWFPNLIVDSGLNVIGTSASWIAACGVGTGNTAPANGQTSLIAQVATDAGATVNVNGAQGSAPYFGYTTKTYRFAEGAAEGNLAEIGIGTNGMAALFSRALILDGGGSPTTITVLADEFLDATYQIRVYPPLVDVTDTINISGVDYDITMRASSVTSAGNWSPGGGNVVGTVAGFSAIATFNGAIGAITAYPSGAQGTGGVIVNAAYGNNNLYREATATWSLADSNLAGGIRCVNAAYGLTVGAGGLGSMQVEFDPPIPKTSSDVLSLTFRHTWARGTI